jgi:hypothetical protein
MPSDLTRTFLTGYNRDTSAPYTHRYEAGLQAVADAAVSGAVTGTVEWGIRWADSIPGFYDEAGPFETADIAEAKLRDSAFAGTVVHRIAASAGPWIVTPTDAGSN